MVEQLLEHAVGHVAIPMLVLFGGAAAVVLVVARIGGRLLRRHAPAWMVGPGGFLIDTTGRLGLLQLPPDGHQHHHLSHHGGGPEGGGPC
ncbi:MAG: hypothetical protein KJZ85_04375 [Rhodobacteraceae bacterium]|jgi:hypothetical protein|nr:hypothetical protein [Paracoccaceae bacterium]